MIKFYGYKKCGTSRKGEKFLNDNGVDFEFIDVTLNPPSKNELKKIIELSGKPLKKFFNTSGVVYREMKLSAKLKTMDENEMFDILASNGKLLKRPMVFDGTKATVAYNEEEYLANWK